MDQRFHIDDPDFDLHFHPLSDMIDPPDNLEDINRIMALAVRYSTTLATGSLVRQASDLESASQAIAFANHWQDLRLVYFIKGAFHSTAIATASEVVITDDMLEVDDRILRDSRSLIATVMAKQAAMKPNRFNAARCWEMFQNDEDFLLLLELATKGAIIDPDLKFILQSIPEEFRHTEVALAKVFQAHAISSWEKGRGLLVRMDTLRDLDQQRLVHFNHSHLVYKFNEALGRWCIDPSIHIVQTMQRRLMVV